MGMKKKRTLNPRLIKARHSYSFSEIAEVYGIRTYSVQRWRKEGLRVLDEASRPFLVMGAEIRRFLEERQRRRRHPLKPGEFFCPKCRCARRSVPGALLTEITEKRLGKRNRQAFIRGVCEVCGQRLLLFSSDKKVRELQHNGLCLSERQKQLEGSGDGSVRADTGRGEDGQTDSEE
jgi:hypothetical protein